MAINKIDLSLLKQKHLPDKQQEKNNFLSADSFQQKITLIFSQNETNVKDYCGLLIIRSDHTNRLIKQLLYQDLYNSNIKINDFFIKQKDIVVISAFSRVDEIINARANGNFHNYLKLNDKETLTKQIQEFIFRTTQEFIEKHKEVVSLDLTKTNMINYLEIVDDFVDAHNIKSILEILKSFDSKKMIIFNDVDYLPYHDLVNYFSYFNFLYIVNKQENNYEYLDNYELLLLEDK